VIDDDQDMNTRVRSAEIAANAQQKAQDEYCEQDDEGHESDLGWLPTYLLNLPMAKRERRSPSLEPKMWQNCFMLQDYKRTLMSWYY